MGAEQSTGRPFSARDRLSRQFAASRRIQEIRERRLTQAEARQRAEDQADHRGLIASTRVLVDTEAAAARRLERLRERLMQGTSRPSIVNEIRVAEEAHTEARIRLEQWMSHITRLHWEAYRDRYEEEEEKRLGPTKYSVTDQDGAIVESADYLFHKIAEPTHEDNCAICLESITSNPGDPRELPCGHAYHHECLRRWFDLESKCPLCRREFRIFRPNGHPNSYFRDLEQRWRREDVLEGFFAHVV